MPIDELEEDCVLTGTITDENFLRYYMLEYDDFNAQGQYSEPCVISNIVVSLEIR